MFQRQHRQNAFFKQVLDGKRTLTTPDNTKRFIEAVLTQDNPAACVEQIIAKPQARSAIYSGLRFDISPTFLNQVTAPFIRYLSNPAVKRLCNGRFLEDIMVIIVEPRSIWNAFMAALEMKQLEESSVHAFAWMLSELLSLPPSSQMDFIDDAAKVTSGKFLLDSSSSEIRELGYKIQNLLSLRSKKSLAGSDMAHVDPDMVPGGRHDNDFPEIWNIAIYPTADELLSTKKPFYRRAHEIQDLSVEDRIAGHIDNQFRLLREDMLCEMREDIQIARGQKKYRRSISALRGLRLQQARCTEGRKYTPLALSFTCNSGLEALEGQDAKRRQKFLKDNWQFLKHRSLGCLIYEGQIISFGSIERDEQYLLLDPPEVVIRFFGTTAFKKTLMTLKMRGDVQFLMVDSPVFAYEPVLRCLQEKTDLPLSKELLEDCAGENVLGSGHISDHIIDQLRESKNTGIQDILKTKKAVTLDPSQFESFISGLYQRVSLIQGPPGTGKSFIGALLSKAFHVHTKEKILVMCYTNHALDQFLEDLIDIGIDASSIVRLGSKSSEKTYSLSLRNQNSNYRRASSTWSAINELEREASDLKESLEEAFRAFREENITYHGVLEYLDMEYPAFYEAFMPPMHEEGMEIMGKGNRTINSTYLFDIWTQGYMYPEYLNGTLSMESWDVWLLDYESRQAHMQDWKKAIIEEHILIAEKLAESYHKVQDRISNMWNDKTVATLKEKRIIGCTTTAAAMYSKDIRQASPGIVLLEEAGEILESHVLTAMAPETKQLVLIGDHQQLRPKINSYGLTVEKGQGYDLNRSLFERLVLAGYPHSTLAKQHRMCPEISSLVRHLTYPELEDDPKTSTRPRCRGIQDRVVFIDHRIPEVQFGKVSDRRDEGNKSSKRNMFEAEMVLKIVKYLGQQGYGTDRLVILTPYLGQLQLLRELLKVENDPVLNDLDSYDLVRAGLLSNAGARVNKRPIRLSTIDNYQGEESDIVIASLTRSNGKGDIGFMSAPQRLNVLLSRAREALIMIGNSETFIKSRSGKETWTKFVNHLNEHHQLYDGLPVVCERHPQRKMVLRTKKDFETECPDGGCTLPCDVMLKCGTHLCPSKCHQLADHSKMECRRVVKWNCSRGHSLATACSKNNGTCRFCTEEDEKKEKLRQRDLELDIAREEKQKKYERTLASLQDELEEERRRRKDENDEKERQRVIDRTRAEVLKLRSSKSPPPENKDDSSAGSPLSPKSPDYTSSEGGAELFEKDSPNENKKTDIKPKAAKSTSQQDWDYQKTFERAQSEEIDTLMGMIGLENVKSDFLTIKAQVDTAVRQGVNLSNERFGTVLVGNPGTGKTTVARIYAKFLSAIGVLPGDKFEETTGSKLANEGVSGCTTIVNNILNNGGGVLFIDEAYQLTEGGSFGAKVVDYLLGEVENLMGKLIIVLAGYKSNMEKFFGQNPGLPSRFPRELRFNDYNDDELREILKYRIHKKYGPRMKITGGMDGLYSRIVARRVGRGRGKEGFANARAVEIAVSRISERQVNRISKERRTRSGPVDDMLLTKEDLIGPEPSQALEDCSAWQKLRELIGLQSVKDTLRALLDSIEYNYHRELEEKPLMDFTLNRVFLGSPGTGKTSVAKLYGQILVDIGLLSNGEVVVKNPADFIGSALGESEKNTKGILAATVGKVLVIDEAYGLNCGGSSSGADPYKTAVVDTIVAEVQSTPGDDRCVLLLGYQDQMTEMFQNVNPGLQRRFPLNSAFVFEDFTDDELGRILDLKLKQQGFETSAQGRKVALEVISRARNQPNFGNAGQIDILLNGTKIRHQQRLSAEKARKKKSQNGSQFEPQDFDKDYDRGERDETNIPGLFSGTVGCEKLIEQLEGYRQTVRNMRKLGIEPRDQIPFNFVFRGPPGTGKTTTARKMGKVYYDMGFLASAEVIESSATDLVGEYTGHTGPKTEKLLEKALGKILLIDEAYRLAEGHFAKEAIDQIVDCVTKPKFKQKLIIILAGYDHDINRLLAVNSGLTSRFPESVSFSSLSADACVTLLINLLQSRVSKLGNLSKIDIGLLETPTVDFQQKLGSWFSALSYISNWANARDVKTLADTIFRKAVQAMSGDSFVLSEDIVLREMDNMVAERLHRQSAVQKNEATVPSVDLPIQTKSSNSHATSTSMHTSQAPPKDDIEEIADVVPENTVGRDPGVSDDTWSQLQADKAREEAQEVEYQNMREAEQKAQEAADAARREEENAIAEKAALQHALDDEERRRHEQERLRRERERRAKEERLDKIRRQREAEEQRRKQEQAVQQKLQEMGVCSMGFRWIKQHSGYRCAGGSHSVSNLQLGCS